ncbi:MAG: hypothetical protein KKF48_02360 [Nanoarchaeota archaeon]|nr:hypothetical protein [Nanoarchaeota archaeon]MBU1027863.1 hypothetical protein [Nanoarchaeota archaeon]
MAWYKPSTWRKKEKKEKEDFPNHYAQIVWTDYALNNSTFDDYNKEIQRIKYGKIVEITPYNESDLEAIKKIYQIPVSDLTKRQGEEFKFESMDSLTGTFSEVRN